ncbi:SidA/IucD/PvdA family monooxygenase [Kibdelosporangium phytohabitans]|uniref:L-lysine N6-monooxygenase MbtG n=1 Tax=Kibdelosporangium phytohabitans TaxID=860235 RepID=A0A0N9I657_9PSEU|nr:SidA/IucD/PvdA family monooxygenase [Kibdelosporangium phytohabitans]ALG15582.1 L-lysine 6-monooxygenase [Kibdelosporangium phytohabitans]MBE1465141.1 L-ornithine N5-oxygenase [Kibdelosporangium phytohabitans]
MASQNVWLLAVGAGPSNLALAVALEELAPESKAANSLIVERAPDATWQREMLFPWTRSQVSFLKDLVTLRNPLSEYTFVNYLHSVGRLDEFVNLGSSTPYRMEISAYLQWVSKSLRRTRIEYNRECVSATPTEHGWTVRMADESTVSCRHLVLGVGRDAHIPAVFAALPREKVIHSTEFRSKLADLAGTRPQTIAVVGGAQSATEMLWESYQSLPGTRCVLLTRGVGLRSYEHSKFANQVYQPSFVDTFYRSEPEVRHQMFADMRPTNYGASDPELLDTLYRQMYQDRLTDQDRLSVVVNSDVVAATSEGDEIVLTVVDRTTGLSEELRCSAVLLGTGFEPGPPRLIRNLGIEDVTVDRKYRVRGVPSLYLQGLNEQTHGIADSLLSVLGIRAGEIVADILSTDEERDGR